MSSLCVVEQLSGYLDGEVSPRARTEIEEHLTHCRECRHHLEGLRAVVDRLESLERVMPPLTVSRAVHQGTRALTGSRRYSIRWQRLARPPATRSKPVWIRFDRCRRILLLHRPSSR